MAEPRYVFSVRTVALGIRFVIPTVPMRVSTPINPTESPPRRTMPTSICGCGKRNRGFDEG